MVIYHDRICKKNHQLNKQKFGKPPTSFPYELGGGEIDKLGNTLAKFVIHSYPKLSKHEA